MLRQALRPAATARIARLSTCSAGRRRAALCCTAAGGVVGASAASAAAAAAQPSPAEEKPPADLSSAALLELQDPQEGPFRYVAYARRAVQTLLVKGRAVAYTSDIGESVRPVVPPWVVKACYGLTWMYVAVDVAYNTAEAHLNGGSTELVARTAVHATTFQVIASVLVPSLIIHQAVHVAQGLATKLPKGPIAFWFPSAVGLCLIPFMPYVDEPIEHAIDAGFEAAWPTPADAPAHGRGHGPDGSASSASGVESAPKPKEAAKAKRA